MPRAEVQKEFAVIRASLSRAVESADPHEWPKFVRTTIRRIEMVMERLETVPAQIGQKGGTKTPERRRGYVRQIAVMRKIRAGGRPKRQSTSNHI
jgi:hypothetical protein